MNANKIYNLQQILLFIDEQLEEMYGSLKRSDYRNLVNNRIAIYSEIKTLRNNMEKLPYRKKENENE